MGSLGDPAFKGMAERIKAVLLKPAETWREIAAEPASPGELIMRWVLPLAAIGPVCGFLRGQLFGYGAFGFSYKPGLTSALSSLVVTYCLGVAGAFGLALIAERLAPRFGGGADRTGAFKLVVYGSLAAWLAGAVQLIPGLGVLGLAGLYSLYLYYTGAAPVMGVPSEKSAGFTAVTILCAAGLYLVIGALGAALSGQSGLGVPGGMAPMQAGSTVSVPGMGKVDTARFEAAAKELQAASSGKPIDPAALAALLPAELGGYTRTAMDSNVVGQLGAEAEATYINADKSRVFKLKIVDSQGLGAVANIGAALGVSESHEDASGYERTSSASGQMRTEKWNTREGRGELSQQVGGRFMVSAQGKVASIDELKAAVAAISPDRLAEIVK